MKWLYYSPIPQTVVSTLPRGLILSDFWEYIGCFLLAPTILLLSTINTWTIQLTSFPQGVIFYFNRLFLFINWNSRMLGKSRTESTDTCQKTLLILLTKWSCRTRVFCWAAQRHGLALLDERRSMGRGISLSLRPEGRETITESQPYLPLTAPLKNLLNLTFPFWDFRWILENFLPLLQEWVRKRILLS